MDIEWGMTHKGNLLAKNGWDKIPWAARHLEMVQKTYTVFSYKIMRQLYKGMCALNDHKYTAAKKTCEWRFNCSLLPMENINKNIGLMLKTLRFLNRNKDECKKYRQSMFNYERGRGAKPVKPDINSLLDYWDDPNHILINHMMELILSKCESFGNKVGTTNKDIVSNYDELDEFELDINGISSKRMEDFEEQKQILSLSEDEGEDEDVVAVAETQEPRNALKIFMKHMNYDQETKIITFENIEGSWKVDDFDLVKSHFRTKLRLLCAAITKLISRYFKTEKREFLRNFKLLFDPKQFQLYTNMNEAAAHGNNIFNDTMNKIKFKKIPFLESERKVEWKQFDVRKMKYEYSVLRGVLYKSKNIHPNDLSKRLQSILLQIEARASIFATSILLLKTFITYLSGVIDVERCNGTKKWIISPRRESMKTPKLNMVLRIYYNSPGIDDPELDEWISEVTKIWYNKGTKIQCEELDRLCDEKANDS